MSNIEKIYFKIYEESRDNPEVTKSWDDLYTLLTKAVGEEADYNNQFYSAICEYGHTERKQAFERGFAFAFSLACELKGVTV